MAKIGRPSKLTPAVKQRLLDAIRAGNYFEAACVYAGIGETTFYRWMERGEKASSGEYREFWESVKKAEAEAEARVVALWQQEIPGNWQAARDFLARRFSDRWSPKEKVQTEVTGKDGGPVEIDDPRTVLLSRLERMAKRKVSERK
jgi:hypothetical protein